MLLPEPLMAAYGLENVESEAEASPQGPLDMGPQEGWVAPHGTVLL